MRQHSAHHLSANTFLNERTNAHIDEIRWSAWARAVLHWFDTARASSFDTDHPAADRIDWLRTLPFILMHAACLFVFVVGVSPVAIIVCLSLYFLRMFAITGFYHRYFSHKSFKTSRVAQFLFGVLGSSAVQRGPIWWAAHHRDHHQYSDKNEDAHSPIQHGFVRAHMSWFLSKKGFAPDLKRVRDLMNFPELRWLDRFDIIVPVLLAVAVFFLGVALEKFAPGLGTNGWQMLVWGFFVSTVLCSHGTYTINSLSHVFGKQRYKTGDSSRNNWFLALITLGRGLAQQSPPLPELDAPGLLLVGNRHHLLPAEGDVVDGDHLGSQGRAPLGPRSSPAKNSPAPRDQITR